MPLKDIASGRRSSQHGPGDAATDLERPTREHGVQYPSSCALGEATSRQSGTPPFASRTLKTAAIESATENPGWPAREVLARGCARQPTAASISAVRLACHADCRQEGDTPASLAYHQEFRDLSAPDSIQMGVPGRWMLGFMRAIYAHANTVEARVETLDSNASARYSEAGLVICDQQK